MPNTMKVMLERFYYFANVSKTPVYPDLDNASRPDLNDGSWTFWRDDPQVPPTNPKFIYPDPMADLKMNDEAGSSAPYIPPDNEKIFKEKAQKFVNVTKHDHKDNHKHHDLNTKQHFDHKPQANTKPKPPKTVHKTVQTVQPNVIIEGIGNLIEPQGKPLTPTEAPYIPATTESSFVPMKPTEAPVIDIQNVLLDDSGSGSSPIISPTTEYLSPTKPPPVKHIKPASLGEVISGKSSKKPSNGDLGEKFHTAEIKVDLPQVYDVIDETDNPSMNQAPKENTNIPNVYDVIDINKEKTKATSNQVKPHAPAKNIPPKHTQPAKITPPAHTQPSSPLSTFFKPKPHAPVVHHPAPHKFIGDIVMDGHKFHVEGTEIGDTSWLMKDFPSGKKKHYNNIFKYLCFKISMNLEYCILIMANIQTNQEHIEYFFILFFVQTSLGNQNIVSGEQSKPTPKSDVTEPKGKDDNPVDNTEYSEVTDIIVESTKENKRGKSKKGSERNLVKPQNVGKLLKDAAEFDSPTKNIPVVSHRVATNSNITKQNDTNCEKPVQLESSDNAVVVSSVVIVVIASAMVVGVALVAMIAVVARHFQRAKNLNAGGAS